MYELTSLLTTIAGCSATIVAIVGGFIASKLISLSTERNEISMRLNEINEEINFKSKQSASFKAELDEDDALDFIRDNIEGVVAGKSLIDVYKKEERPNISEEDIMPYWDKAISTFNQFFNLIRNGEKTNDDGIPISLSSHIKHFEYSVCEYAINYLEKVQKQIEREKNQYSLNLSPAFDSLDILPQNNSLWYQKTSDEMNSLNTSIEWLQVQKRQLLSRKNALIKPKGMLSGLMIFGLFSLLGIIVPLILIPFYTDNYLYYIRVKYSSIVIFIVGIFAVFLYLINLLIWKDKKEV